MSWPNTIIVDTARPKLSVELIESALGISNELAQVFRHPGTTENQIIDYVVNKYSDEGDTVIDPMCGTGTIVKRALQLKRRAYGLEVVEQYATLANAAIQKELGEKDRVKRESALHIEKTAWLIELSPIKLFFFSPPLLDINRGSYPSSHDQVGNYKLGQEHQWLDSIFSIMKQINYLIDERGYVAILWLNQIGDNHVLPLTQLGVSGALDIGYHLIDEKVCLFQTNQNRKPEMLHIFQKK